MIYFIYFALAFWLYIWHTWRCMLKVFKSILSFGTGWGKISSWNSSACRLSKSTAPFLPQHAAAKSSGRFPSRDGATSVLVPVRKVLTISKFQLCQQRRGRLSHLPYIHTVGRHNRWDSSYLTSLFTVNFIFCWTSVMMPSCYLNLPTWT